MLKNKVLHLAADVFFAAYFVTRAESGTFSDNRVFAAYVAVAALFVVLAMGTFVKIIWEAGN